MTEKSVRIGVGTLLLFTHLALIVYSIVAYIFITGFSFSIDELTTVLGFLLPVFGIYVSAFVKFIVKTRNDTNDATPKVSRAYVGLVFGLVGFYFALLVGLLTIRALNIIGFDLLKYLISVSQIAIGVYAGILLTDLFELRSGSRKQRKKGSGSRDPEEKVDPRKE